MDWSLDGFFADGGSTKFVDRLANALGINSSEIKIVTVWEGSVFVELNIVPENQDAENVSTLSAKLFKGLKDGSIFLGADLLEAYNGGKDIFSTDKETDSPY